MEFMKTDKKVLINIDNNNDDIMVISLRDVDISEN